MPQNRRTFPVAVVVLLRIGAVTEGIPFQTAESSDSAVDLIGFVGGVFRSLLSQGEWAGSG